MIILYYNYFLIANNGTHPAESLLVPVLGTSTQLGRTVALTGSPPPILLPCFPKVTALRKTKEDRVISVLLIITS